MSAQLALLRDLKQEWEHCTKCDLHRGRKHTVFASGHENADVMLIAEMPGRDEDECGYPFVGKAGRQLDMIAEYANVDIGKELHLTNLVQCQPPKGRSAFEHEILACWPRLVRQIQIVAPLLIIAAGRAAAHRLVGGQVSVTKDRGQIFDCNFPGVLTDEVRIPVFVMLHPADVMRNPDMNPGGALRETLDDFISAFEIVDKMREEWFGTPPKNRRINR